MRHGWSAATAIVAVSVTFAAVRRATRPVTASDAIAGSGAMPIYSGALARLDRSLARLDATLTARDTSEVRHAFREARAAYEGVELFVEHYGATEVRALNGVPMLKAEDEDPETPLASMGLQVVESIVFPFLDAARTTEARQLVAYMRAAVQELSCAGADTIPGDAYLFEAIRQEITRVSTLGIPSLDANASGDAIIEAAEALTGVREALVPYRQALIWRAPAALARVDVTLDAAIAYLRAYHDVDSFDRLTFISRHAGPIARALATAQQALAIGAPRQPRAWSAQDRGSPRLAVGFPIVARLPRPRRHPSSTPTRRRRAGGSPWDQAVSGRPAVSVASGRSVPRAVGKAGGTDVPDEAGQLPRCPG
jgi:cytochrome c peroxidase